MTLAIAEAWADQYQPPSERAVAMARLYVEEGLTLQEIGERYGVSRQRVDQILKPFGLEPHYGQHKKEQRAQRLKEAQVRIRSGEATSSQEAERLGYANAHQLRQALNDLGLRLRDPLPPAEHGSDRRYRQGCRCDECRRVHRETEYAWRAKRGVHEDEHGRATSYVNYGCRCAKCREAVRIQSRAARARRRQLQESTD